MELVGTRAEVPGRLLGKPVQSLCHDLIYGGRGADQLFGGRGRDRLFGRAGADVLNVRDGWRDVANCGPGRDVVIADKGDKVAKNCEIVRRK